MTPNLPDGVSWEVLGVFERLKVSEEDRTAMFSGSRKARIVAIRRECAKAMRAAGYSYSMIASELGMGRSAAMYLCKDRSV